LALTLEAIGRLSGLRGEGDNGARGDNGAKERSDAIFRRLGLIARTALPP
jgi:hypothetical protein